MTEFDIIRRYFTRPVLSAALGPGDDCALVMPQDGMMLAVSSDMLIEGRHFLPGADARMLGHKVLAVNLSDLAAMGADPRWVTLAAALPDANEAWLAAFAEGFFALAEKWSVELIGGDTNRGALAFSVTAMGEVPVAFALRRDGARAGDDIWVSGSTGAAALGLAHLQGRVKLGALAAACLARLHTPEPRVELGGRLRGLATSAIDTSDGLLADLAHILESSSVGANVLFDRLPRPPEVAACDDQALARECLLSGGEDYELLFTAPHAREAEVEALSRELGLPLTSIGTITRGEAKITLRDAAGSAIPATRKGYDHFG